jgi:hypothetical protein
MLRPSGLAQYSSTASFNHQRGQPIVTLKPQSSASSFALRNAHRRDSERLGILLLGTLGGCIRAPMEGSIVVSGRLGQIMVNTFRESVNLHLSEPMASQSSSCSSQSAMQPGQFGEEGTRAGGSGRGGSAAKAGASNAAAPGDHPVPGGSSDSSTATAAEGTPQSPRDHHLASALAFALAFDSFSLALVPGSR